MIGGYAAKRDGTGWKRVDGEFPDENNPTGVYPDLSFEYFTTEMPADPVAGTAELEADAIANIDRFLTVAALRIAPLQDAADLDGATPADLALLKKWKQYRVAVNRVPDQPEYPKSITWPVEPS